jgi:hypothetical protein
VVGIKNKIPYFIWLRNQELFFLPGPYSAADLQNPGNRGNYQAVYIYPHHQGGKSTAPHHPQWRAVLWKDAAMALEWIKKELLELEYRKILVYEIAESNMGY